MPPKHSHILRIREGTPEDADFFFEIEEQLTWENLPPDCATMSRAEMREKLKVTHGLLLSCPGNVFFIARVEDRIKVLRSGFQIHLPKPVDGIELVNVVATLAGRHGKV